MKKTPAVAATPAETPAVAEPLPPEAQVWKQRFEQEFARANEVTRLWSAAEAKNRQMLAIVQQQQEVVKSLQARKPKAPKPSKTVN